MGVKWGAQYEQRPKNSKWQIIRILPIKPEWVEDENTLTSLFTGDYWWRNLSCYGVKYKVIEIVKDNN